MITRYQYGRNGSSRYYYPALIVKLCNLASVSSISPFQCSLLFRKLNNFAVDKHTFPLSHAVHITLRDIISISFLTQVFQLLLSCWYPERILVKQFISCAPC